MQQQQDLAQKGSNGASASTSGAEEDAIWLQLLNKMTGHVVAHLPKIWQLVQVSIVAYKLHTHTEQTWTLTCIGARLQPSVHLCP